MHEYRLYTQIPTTRRTQVLNILAGTTASQPTPITQQTLIYQQLKSEATTASKKGQSKPSGAPGQQQRLSYVKLVRDTSNAKNGSDAVAGSWRLREEGLPDPAVKTVISAAVTERELEKSELLKFKPTSDTHKFISSYISSGTRFVHHNIVIYISRLYAKPSLTGTPDTDPLDVPPPTLDNANLLDPSGAWLVEVCVRVDDGGNSGLREWAVKELEGFRRELEAAVDLRVPDRLAMDPRVK